MPRVPSRWWRCATSALTIAAGEMVAIVGASGSGKSTLLNILGCLDRPTGGSYRVLGRETRGARGRRARRAQGREHFGFIFQRYHLMAELTAAGNVEMPAVYAGLTLPGPASPRGGAAGAPRHGGSAPAASRASSPAASSSASPSPGR